MCMTGRSVLKYMVINIKKLNNKKINIIINKINIINIYRKITNKKNKKQKK